MGIIGMGHIGKSDSRIAIAYLNGRSTALRKKGHTMKTSDLANNVAGLIRKRIIMGTLAANTGLREVPLAQEYGIARGTLRTALQALENEGLVKTHENGRRTVNEFTEANIADVYMVRTMIETKALSLIRERSVIPYGSIASSLDNIASARPEKDLLVHLDLAFHRSIIEASASPCLLRCWETLSPAVEALLTINTDTSYKTAYEKNFYSIHKHIFDGISHDKSLESFLISHISTARDLSISLLRKHRQSD